jgi:hypothetical protein
MEIVLSLITLCHSLFPLFFNLKNVFTSCPCKLLQIGKFKSSTEIQTSRDTKLQRLPLTVPPFDHSYVHHGLNIKYEVRYTKFIWAPCAQLYSLAEIPQPPAFGLIYEGAFGQSR